jgi:hypothetical protein
MWSGAVTNSGASTCALAEPSRNLWTIRCRYACPRSAHARTYADCAQQVGIINCLYSHVVYLPGLDAQMDGLENISDMLLNAFG